LKVLTKSVKLCFTQDSRKAIPSFCLRNNNVQLHNWSPFWVGTFIILIKQIQEGNADPPLKPDFYVLPYFSKQMNVF